jgi:hypothetical protein
MTSLVSFHVNVLFEEGLGWDDINNATEAGDHYNLHRLGQNNHQRVGDS